MALRELEGGKRAGGWSTFRRTLGFMERKHSNLGSHALVGTRDQGNVVKVAGCCADRKEKQTGLRRKSDFPSEVTTEYEEHKNE